MTEIALYGGPLKRSLIEAAYETCGQAGYEVELTPEEYTSALRRLNGKMHEWLSRGIDLGYNFPANGTQGSPEDESGIPDGATEPVAQTLARMVAPGIGKSLSAEARSEYSGMMSAFFATYQTIPTRQLGRQTPRGAGSRLYGWRRPFFVAPVSDDEPVQ